MAPKGRGFSAVLVINSVSILADFKFINIRYAFLHSNLGMSITGFKKRPLFRHYRKENQQNPFTNYVKRLAFT